MTTQATHATPATPQTAPASPSEISDGIYAELCVIRRRLSPVVARISQLSTRGVDLGPWTQTLRAAEQAALQLATAIESVPTPIWEPDTAYSSVIHVRDLTIDPEARRAWLGETDIPLTIREFDVLIAFARNPTRVIRRRSSCGPSGAFAARAVREPSTPTSAVFGESSSLLVPTQGPTSSPRGESDGP